ncbi:MAG: hypothetical protein DRZ80_01890 [Thermoprotei archaeon]|nr:MAG: hypothetical protein DRZ80_01890 [Thermoprotei archaeon]
MRRKYRSHVGILLDILRAIDSEGRATISRIILIANIPYERLKPYLEKLLREGYIREVFESEKKLYEVTEKGYKLMHELQMIKRVFDRLGFPL